MSTVILFTEHLHHSKTLTFELLGAIASMSINNFRYSHAIIRFLVKTGMDDLSNIF